MAALSSFTRREVPAIERGTQLRLDLWPIRPLFEAARIGETTVQQRRRCAVLAAGLDDDEMAALLDVGSAA